MSEIILASASPRRQELLKLLGIGFRVVESRFDESTVLQWPPDEHVIVSSSGKANSIADRIDDGIVIGADTIVVIDEQILGKPRNEDDAKSMLHKLSGRSHYVYTGLAVIEKRNRIIDSSMNDYVRTEVIFAKISDAVIDAYVETGEPLDKAGAYGIQERGSVLVEGIVGDYFNVVGLPIFRLSRMLERLGITLFGV